MQPDGSMEFWQLVLTCESEEFAGWGGEEPVVPDTATVMPIRLVSTEDGWRVNGVNLPN